MILNTTAETMTASEKELIQSQKLQKLVERCYKKIYFYQQRIDALNINYTSITHIHDISKLPFTTANDLAINYPFGLLTMPINGVARFEQTTDFHKVIGFTIQDLAWQKEMIARTLFACHINAASILLELPEPFPSSGARSLQQTAENLGIAVIVSHESDDQSCLKKILDFGVTTLFATPNKLLAFADFLQKQNIAKHDIPLINIICEAHHCPANLRDTLMDKFQVPVYTLYGHPDIMCLGIAGECYQQKGLHIQDDHFYPEIINPHDGKILDDGQPGELVLTTLSREATPLLRYRTDETAILTHEHCPCGRTSARLTLVP
ncbi:Phenylacetate-coenzyme A ligase [bioreactor metagenome]|uniref:Phenylacetate-coenzyme A ligase n=1 Tax=bioreactor metagenome TaxID=1076179 RepID=A0A644TFU1_9ZZZZ|nr:phenylacetate--CoA ligase family protein [Negativicutes bacterium]